MTERSLYQLTLAWVRGFYREPEAIFWVFGFPIVLAFALGIAFKNRGPGEMRIGVERGHPESVLRNHVLSKFPPSERDVVERAVGRAADAVETFVSDGLQVAMNRFNASDDNLKSEI